jgi:eukaryotic-like serine/threonine-protein kinase
MSQGEKPPGRVAARPLSGGPVKFGPFWLEARLAVGGTAEVYVARPIDPNARPSRLVVKRLLPQFLSDPEGRTMFEREGLLHAAVQHENVVQVFGFGTADEEPWLAMELVDGCDLFRLLRRLWAEGRTLAPGIAVFVARELLRGLERVHSACDAGGQPMGIIHRDVTPSNVYLSIDGGVKLGDFGIARSTSRSTLRVGASAKLKGKFSYLSPEQVAGEPFDHRADLFAVGAVLSEMLIGRALFAGSGQLAVLLAIRDCRIEPLKEARARLPTGLVEVLERALARDPSARLPNAEAFRGALAPFDSDPKSSRAELRALVRWVQSASSVEQMQAVREPPPKPRDRPAPASDESKDADGERATGEYTPIPSFVVLSTGKRLGPWSFARLVEAIATGQVTRGDKVDYVGRGLQPLESIDDLGRFLPSGTVTTNRLTGVTAPDLAEEVSTTTLVTILVRVIETAATGVLFAEGLTESRRLGTPDEPAPKEGGRKELYFVGGKLHHVSSNNASELLGEYLVRRKVISREELDFALAVLPRYGGRMGDTLIGLGLVGSLEIFRAIRDQGRDRLIDLFQWQAGRLSFYSGHTAPHVEFPLELDLPPLLIAGLEAAEPGETPLAAWRDRFDDWLVPAEAGSLRLRDATWPPLVRRLLDIVSTPKPLREVLAWIAQDGTSTASDALRVLEVLIGAKLLSWR